jgi:arginase
MRLSVIQVPYDSGQFNMRMGCGPLHLTNEGLVNWFKSEGHIVQFNEVRLPNQFMPEVAASIYIEEQVKHIVEENIRDGALPLVLAGNCNYAAFGITAAIHKNNTGIFWFDAHGDFNTPETSISGFFDGMALSILTGNSWPGLRKSMKGFNPIPEEQVILIGVHDLDAEEEMLLKNSKIKRMDTQGIRNKLAETINPIFQHLLKNVESIYIHIDLDVLDKSEFKANQFAAPGGLRLNELITIISEIKRTFKIAAAALTAFDPAYDHELRANDIVRTIITHLTKT